MVPGGGAGDARGRVLVMPGGGAGDARGRGWVLYNVH